jgi:hypothetical protein
MKMWFRLIGIAAEANMKMWYMVGLVENENVTRKEEDGGKTKKKKTEVEQL